MRAPPESRRDAGGAADSGRWARLRPGGSMARGGAGEYRRHFPAVPRCARPHSNRRCRVASRVDRQAVDLSAYPDLVVIYLGMRVRALPGVKTLLGFGPQIDRAGASRPEGLLHYEDNIIFSFFPLHVGMRWYWRDLAAMEQWARSEPHRVWWQQFLSDSGSTGFWHETYFMRG